MHFIINFKHFSFESSSNLKMFFNVLPWFSQMPNLSFMYQLSHSKVRQKPGMAEKEGCFRCGKDGHWYVVWHCQICIVVSANVCCQSKYSANILVNKIFILMNAKIYVNEFVFIFVYWLSHREVHGPLFGPGLVVKFVEQIRWVVGEEGDEMTTSFAHQQF